jgi:putative DNA primase/helicase
VDPRHGGEVSLKDLERKYGVLPETVQSRTGGGGYHYYFRCPGVPVKNSSGSLGLGLDIKADEGYVTAPPSVHVSGQPYTWEKGCSPEDLPVAPLPGWLLSLLQAPIPQTPTHGDGQPVAEGERNTTLTSLAGTMRRSGMSQEAILAARLVENERICEPPLPEDKEPCPCAGNSHPARVRRSPPR